MGAVLAFDIATTTGWAWHRPGMPRPFFGAERLPGGRDIGPAMNKLLRFADTLMLGLARDGTPVTHVFYEKPFIPGDVNSATSTRLMALCGAIELGAFWHKAACYSVDISEWRKHFIGRGSGFKRTADKKRYLPGHDPKELAVQRCAQYGWHTDIADAAEACGVLDYALSMMPTHERPWRDRLILGATA